MPPEQKKQAVNWTDGMKLNKDHFIEHENWVLDGIRNTASLRLTEFNYGLLSCFVAIAHPDCLDKS